MLKTGVADARYVITDKLVTGIFGIRINRSYVPLRRELTQQIGIAIVDLLHQF